MHNARPEPENSRDHIGGQPRSCRLNEWYDWSRLVERAGTVSVPYPDLGRKRRQFVVLSLVPRVRRISLAGSLKLKVNLVECPL